MIRLQAIGGETNSNLILLPNSPQAGSNMLNDMVASFTASNQIGEAMKEKKINPIQTLKKSLLLKGGFFYNNQFYCFSY